MELTRRTYTLGAATALFGAGAVANSVASQQSDDPDLAFGDLSPEAEYLELYNTGDSEADIEGFYINWEYGQEVDQYDQFTSDAGATTIPAGEFITVATGAGTQDADVVFDRDAEAMNDEEQDTYSIETAEDGEVIARSDQDRYRGDGGDGGDGGDSTPTETESPTPTPDDSDGGDGGDGGDGATPTPTPDDTDGGGGSTPKDEDC